MYVVTSTGDRITVPSEQNLLARAYGHEAVVVKNLCHDMMLDPEWEIAATALAELVQRIEVDCAT